MFAVNNSEQDPWVGDDMQSGSLVSSVSGQSRSELDNFAAEQSGGKQASNPLAHPLGNGPTKTPGVLRTGEAALMRNGQAVLPMEKAFSIQIGWRLFRLSGASIMSDAPSYFSTYFDEQLRLEERGSGPMKTLFIDRDPDTFADICRHLQGYWVIPRDNAHYVKLYADAQFYSLPRLISLLFDSEICVAIGGQQFQIPRDTFSGPGNSSNFFSLGFAGFLGTRDDAFPGLESKGLMRPPPVQPQSVPNRSPKVFADLIHLSRGYPLTIRDAHHRAELLSDCKYYGFKGLMHKIFVHSISYNADRGTSEIVMRLEDLHKSGISFIGDASPSDQSPLGGWVNYSRPFVDEQSYECVVEIGNQETKIDFRSMRADFYGDTKARISSLFQVVADKMNLPSNLPLGLMMSSGGASAAPVSPANTPLSEDRVKIRIGPEAHVILDGENHTMDDGNLDLQHNFDPSSPASSSSTLQTPSIASPWLNSSSNTLTPTNSRPPPTKKRKRRGSLDDFGEWIVKKGQWRLRVQPRTEPNPRSMTNGDSGMEIILVAVKLNAVSGQRGRNMTRDYIS
ncbi:hypothetical protein N7G274_008420 [Stereocaulon virgatum]|uniref:Potassium channel tetramerisation-type BTB domain-containing protein n=1 Tax=Stereocaulon virgatum TaxID=373712 RepID=A0ABR4A1I4_9LECA